MSDQQRICNTQSRWEMILWHTVPPIIVGVFLHYFSNADKIDALVDTQAKLVEFAGSTDARVKEIEAELSRREYRYSDDAVLKLDLKE
ncbi:MAG: hypothetical protein AAF607_15870 [Pseudomonadota bacterium]